MNRKTNELRWKYLSTDTPTPRQPCVIKWWGDDAGGGMRCAVATYLGTRFELKHELDGKRLIDSTLVVHWFPLPEDIW